MGGGSGSTTTLGPSITQQSSSPWGPQQSYLTNAWQSAQNNYNSQSGNPYSGQFTAGPTNAQYSAYQGAIDGAINQQNDVNNQFGQGTAESKSGFGTVGNTVNSLGALSAGNTAGNLTNQAGQIASGFNVPAEVTAATNQAQMLANETTIPNIYRQAAGQGDINSSQTALQQGMVEQGLAMNAQTLGATLANQNYGTGLTSAQNLTSQDLQAMQQQGALGLGLTSAGVNSVNSGISNQSSLNNQAETGANGIQNLNQLANTSNLGNYLGPQSLQNQQLAALYSIIGSGQWGGQGTGLGSGSTTNTQNNPSVLGSIGAGLGSLGSIFGTGGTNTGLLSNIGNFFTPQ